MKKYLIVFLWTNCSWKSSYAREILWGGEIISTEFDGCKISIWDDSVALWRYKTNCWGADGMKKVSDIKENILNISIWRNEKIFVVEWVLLTYRTVLDFIRRAQIISWRETYIFYLKASEKTLQQRLLKRNWWKALFEQQLKKKKDFDKRFHQFRCLESDNLHFIEIDTEKISVKDWVYYIKNILLNK